MFVRDYAESLELINKAVQTSQLKKAVWWDENAKEFFDKDDMHAVYEGLTEEEKLGMSWEDYWDNFVDATVRGQNDCYTGMCLCDDWIDSLLYAEDRPELEPAELNKLIDTIHIVKRLFENLY